jgi:hypothetical protein
VNFFSRLYYRYKKLWKALRLFLMVAGPGIIVMVADTFLRYGFRRCPWWTTTRSCRESSPIETR